MKAGCVPIVSNIESGIPDVIEDCKDGFLIEPENSFGFANAIIDLHNNPELLESNEKSCNKERKLYV